MNLLWLGVEESKALMFGNFPVICTWSSPLSVSDNIK